MDNRYSFYWINVCSTELPPRSKSLVVHQKSRLTQIIYVINTNFRCLSISFYIGFSTHFHPLGHFLMPKWHKRIICNIFNSHVFPFLHFYCPSGIELITSMKLWNVFDWKTKTHLIFNETCLNLIVFDISFFIWLILTSDILILI